MTDLFRNNSPGALTRQQAVALQKKRMKERERQAQELAAAGRGEDTEIAHFALGELVIPAALQTPELVAALRRVAAEHNIPLERLRVGSAKNSINPNTGAAEFGSWLDLFRDGYDRFDPADGIQGESYPSQGYYDASDLYNIPGITVSASPWNSGGNTFSDVSDFGSADRSEDGADGASRPQKPYLVGGPPIGEVTTTATRSPRTQSFTPLIPKASNRPFSTTNTPYSHGKYAPRAEDSLPGGDPKLPGGDTVSGNLDRTRRDLQTWGKVGQIAGQVPGVGPILQPLIGAAGPVAQWVDRVWPTHAWDYKRQTPGYDFAGNYNYGATGSALFPEEILLRGAGAAQKFLPGPYDPTNGVPWGDWPYGDDPEDSANISAGYAYGRSVPPRR